MAPMKLNAYLIKWKNIKIKNVFNSLNVVSLQLFHTPKQYITSTHDIKQFDIFVCLV